MDWMLEAFRRTLDQERLRPTARAAGGNRAPARPVGRGHDDRAPNVRRVHIPEGQGRETRPLGIPTRHGTDRPEEPDVRAFEDEVLPGTARTFRGNLEIVQRAVVMAPEAVYEQG